MKNRKPDIDVEIQTFTREDVEWAAANNKAVDVVLDHIAPEGNDPGRWARLAAEIGLTDEQFRSMIQAFTFRDEDEVPDDPANLDEKLKERGYSFTCGLATGILFEQFRSGTRTE